MSALADKIEILRNIREELPQLPPPLQRKLLVTLLEKSMDSQGKLNRALMGKAYPEKPCSDDPISFYEIVILSFAIEFLNSSPGDKIIPAFNAILEHLEYLFSEECEHLPEPTSTFH